MALCGVRLGSSWLGSRLGPRSVPLGSALVRDSGLNICIRAGLATLTNQGLANHGPPFREPKCCFDAFSMGGERVPILFIKIWSEPLEPLRGRVSPPWPSGYKRRNPTLMPVVRARFEPRCGRPHFAPTRSGVRVCGRNRTGAREREWAEGTVSSLPGTLNVRIKFCHRHSTGIARSGGGVRASTTGHA